MKSSGEHSQEAPSEPPRRRDVIGMLIAIASVIFISISLAAYQLGLDSNREWGLSRKLLFMAGGAGLFAGMYRPLTRFAIILTQTSQKFTRNLQNRFMSQAYVRTAYRVLGTLSRRGVYWVRDLPVISIVQRMICTPIHKLMILLSRGIPGRWLLGSRNRQLYSLAMLVGALVLFFYLWLVSIGTWTDWRSTTEYYDKLATAYLYGQTSLLDSPKQELLDLEDPYDIEQRGELPYLWDSSLHNGKYYLYWGPTPALISAPLKLITGASAGDQILTFAFLTGTFFFCSLILLKFWREFDRLPLWTIIPAIVGAGLINPMPWLLGRPAVYEAAIASGQFFLIAGMYLAFTSVAEHRVSCLRAGLASCCWAYAIGSRVTLLPAIIFLILVRIFAVHFGENATIVRSRRVRYTLAISVPMLIGISILCWYNYTRFGNILDFGHRYQLTGMNLNLIYEKIISISNVVPNLYNYIFTPMRSLEVFPYLKPSWGTHFAPPVLGVANSLYYTEQVTGILRSSPYVLFGMVPAFIYWRFLRSEIDEGTRFMQVIYRTIASDQWLKTIQFSMASLLLFIPILFFIVCTMRYLADVIPTLVILSCLGFWMGYQRLADHKILSGLFSLLGIGLTLGSVTIGILLAITGYEARFEQFNPLLFDQITRFLTP